MQQKRSLRSAAIAAAFLCLGAISTVHAAESNTPVWVFQLENDYFTYLTNTDRHYTNGVRLSRISEPGTVPRWLGALAAIPSNFGPSGAPTSQRWAVSLGHTIFTPDDTDAVELIPDDRPYAGWAYLGFSVYSEYEAAQGKGRQDVFSIEAGIVGPSALGEQVQNTYHNLINTDLSRGWDNQLEDEPGLKLGFARKWRTARWDITYDGHYAVDMIPHIAVSLGNVRTDAAVGGLVRLGDDLKDDFGPPRIRPGLPGSESFGRGAPLDWYVFAGGELRAVARDIFLDGNTWKDSHSVDKEPLVLDMQVGFAVLFRDIRLTYTHIFVSPEFKQQSAWDQYGAITLSLQF